MSSSHHEEQRLSLSHRKKGLLHGVSVLRSFSVSSFKATLSQTKDLLQFAGDTVSVERRKDSHL